MIYFYIYYHSNLLCGFLIVILYTLKIKKFIDVKMIKNVILLKFLFKTPIILKSVLLEIIL